MKNWYILILGLILVVILFIAAKNVRKKQKEKTKSVSYPSDSNGTQGISFGNTRGLRNNNPGNIEKGATWIGSIGDDGRFVIFQDMEHGARAMIRVIKNYITKYQINTPKEIIKRWAPEHENDTASYIQFVSQNTGISENTQLKTTDDSHLVNMARIMAYMETGVSLPTSIFEKGLYLEKTL